MPSGFTCTSDATPTLGPFKTVGTRPIRPDGIDKVTGRAMFGADIRLPGMLDGAVLRSPHAHARIVAIDTQPGGGVARRGGGGYSGGSRGRSPEWTTGQRRRLGGSDYRKAADLGA